MGQKIIVTMEIPDDLADPGHPMGITEGCYEELTDALNEFGDVLDVKAAAE